MLRVVELMVWVGNECVAFFFPSCCVVFGDELIAVEKCSPKAGQTIYIYILHMLLSNFDVLAIAHCILSMLLPVSSSFSFSFGSKPYRDPLGVWVGSMRSDVKTYKNLRTIANSEHSLHVFVSFDRGHGISHRAQVVKDMEGLHGAQEVMTAPF